MIMKPKTIETSIAITARQLSTSDEFQLGIPSRLR